MLSSRNLRYTFWLLLFANVVNILFLMARIWGVVMVRPYVLYDYLIIPLLILLRAPSILIWLGFVGIFLTDLLMQVSFIYLFSLSDFINNLKFFSLYDLSWSHYALFVTLIISIAVIFVVIRKLIALPGIPRALAASILAGFAIIVYMMDFLNGKTLANDRKILKTSDANLGGALVRDVYLLVRDFTLTPTKPVIRTEPSVTFETFSSDTTGNQLLIIVESWGLPSREPDQKEVQELLEERAKKFKWKIDFGETPFKGSTIQAELRELFNASGDYRYFLNSDSGRTLKSIFDLKKKHGYTTYAVHSFTGQMFQRNTWWKAIGIDSIYFMENLVRRKKISYDRLNFESPFTSLNDEDSFCFINEKGLGQKQFAYFLTVNTHLPYSRANIKNKNELIGYALSEEGRTQLERVIELLSFFIEESSKKEWSEILIVGDHMPPFTDEFDRDFYSNKRVPYLFLRK